MEQRATELKTLGATIVSTWHQPKQWVPDAELSAGEKRVAAFTDIEELRAADLIICFTEQPDTQYSSGGRHVELGIAIAKRVLLDQLTPKIMVVGPIENVYCAIADVITSAWEIAKQWVELAIYVKK